MQKTKHISVAVLFLAVACLPVRAAENFRVQEQQLRLTQKEQRRKMAAEQQRITQSLKARRAPRSEIAVVKRQMKWQKRQLRAEQKASWRGLKEFEKRRPSALGVL